MGQNSSRFLNHVISPGILHKLPNPSLRPRPVGTLRVFPLFKMSNGKELREVPEEKVSIVQAALGRDFQACFDLQRIYPVYKPGLREQ